MKQTNDKARRKFMRQVAYSAPAIVTLSVLPTFASRGSVRNWRRGNNGVGNGLDPQPPSRPFTPPRIRPNDGIGTAPGSPGRRR